MRCLRNLQSFDCAYDLEQEQENLKRMYLRKWEL